MKKTLIVLVALSGLAMAEFTPADITVYSGAFTQGNGAANVATLTTGTANVWFAEDGKTLESWCIELTLNSDTKTGPGETVFRTTTASTGLGLQAWGPEKNTYRGSAFYATSLHQNDMKDFEGSTQTSLEIDFGSTTHTAATQTPVTLRMGYDAKNRMAYLYNVSSSKGVMLDTSAISTLTTTLKSGTSGTLNTEGAFAVWGGERVYTNVTVYDLTNVATEGAIGTADFKAFMANPVPEPATATLSLLALAGLAARRRH